MATIIMTAYTAAPRGNGMFSVAISLMSGDGPFPRREVVVKTTADALAAFDTYKADATATGLPLAVSMRVKKGDRAPNGFNKIHNGGFCGVNV